MPKQKTPVGVIAEYVKNEIPKQIEVAVKAIPEPVDGLNGVGVDAEVWVKGVYRKNSLVTHHIGQYFKSIKDTSDEPGSQSKDWERIGLSGFCMRGPFDSDTKYTNGDFYVKDFGLFLFINEKSFLIAGRGQTGKRGEVGAIGKSGADGSDIVSFDVNETNLIMVIKDGGGRLKNYSVDLSPLLEASIEVSRAFGDKTLDKVPGVVKSLLDTLYVHPIDEKATPVRFFRGAWHTSTKYKIGDIVVFGEVLLVAKENNKGELPIGNLQNPLGTNKAWRIMASFESKGMGGGVVLGGGVVPGAPGVPGIVGPITGDMVTINIDPANPINLNEMIAALGTMFEDLALEKFITHGYSVPTDAEGKDGDEFFLQSFGNIKWDLTSKEANTGKPNHAIGYSELTPVTATYGTLTLTGVAQGYTLVSLYRDPDSDIELLRCTIYGPVGVLSPLVLINGISLGEVVRYDPDITVKGTHVSSHTYELRITHELIALLSDGVKSEVIIYEIANGATHPFSRFEKRNGHWHEVLDLLADGSVLLEKGYLPEHKRSVASKEYVDGELDDRIFMFKGSTPPDATLGTDGDIYYQYNIPSHSSDLYNVAHIDKATTSPAVAGTDGTALVKVNSDGTLKGKSVAPIVEIAIASGIKVSVGTAKDLTDGSSDIYLYFYPATDNKVNWDEVLKITQITLGTTVIPLFAHFTYADKSDVLGPVVFKIPNFNLLMGAFMTGKLPIRFSQVTGTTTGKIGLYNVFEKVGGVWIGHKPLQSDGTVSMEDWYYPTSDSDIVNKLYVDDELKIQADRLDPPSAQQNILRQFTFDPELKKSIWSDDRERIDVVPDIASLSDRTVLPLSHIVEGKLVYVTGEHAIFELITNNAHMKNNAKDWRKLGGDGSSVSFVSRFMNLPDPNKKPPKDGSVFIIELDFEGDPYHRMVIWDNNIKGEADTVTVKCKPFDATHAIATTTELTVALKSSKAIAFAGQWYVITTPAGLTPLAGEPYAGTHLLMGTKIVNLGNVSRGVMGWIIAPADTGFVDIATTPPEIPIDQVVSDTSIPVKTGGWRFINRMNWVHSSVTDLDHTIDNQIGDFQTTIEKDNHGLKVFTGSGWINLFSEDEIREWIAAMSLFQGTVDLDDDPTETPPFVHAIGAIELSHLPDLAALTVAKDASQSSHYWTWVGEVNHAVKVTDAIIGADLSGATLNPGDWIQIANKGTALVPDLAWTHIGGDLLTKRRADALYGLTTWTNGNYEEHSLVNYKGDAYRAMAGVVAGDNAPDTLITAVIPKTGAVITVTASTAMAITDSVTMKQLMVTAPKPAQWIAYPITASFTAAATLTGFDGTLMAQTRAVIWTGLATLEYATANFIIHKGWLYIDNATPANIAIKSPFYTAMKAVESINKWEKVDLGGGIKTVPSDTDLPKMGMTKDTYLVLVSQKHRSKPVIVTWDQAQRKWVLVGSGSDIGLRITGGNLTYSKNYVTAANINTPSQCGRFAGDLLIAQDKPNAQYYPKSSYNIANTEVPLGTHLLTVGRAGARPNTAGQRGDMVVTPPGTNIPACTYVSDGNNWINQSAGGIFYHTKQTLSGYAWNDHSWKGYLEKKVDIPASLVNRWVKISVTLYYAADDNNTGIARVIFDNSERVHHNMHATGDVSLSRNAEFVFIKQMRSSDISAGIHVSINYGWHGGGAVLIKSYRIIAEDIGFITS